jgi:hypothetical protein
MTFFKSPFLHEATERFYEPESQHRLASIYWPILLSVASALVFVAVGYGVWQFFVPPQPVIPTVAVKNSSIGFDENDLLRIVEILEKRKERFEALLTQ